MGFVPCWVFGRECLRSDMIVLPYWMGETGRAAGSTTDHASDVSFYGFVGLRWHGSCCSWQLPGKWCTSCPVNPFAVLPEVS